MGREAFSGGPQAFSGGPRSIFRWVVGRAAARIRLGNITLDSTTHCGFVPCFARYRSVYLVEDLCFRDQLFINDFDVSVFVVHLFSNSCAIRCIVHTTAIDYQLRFSETKVGQSCKYI